MSAPTPEYVPQNLLDQEEHTIYEPAAERGLIACVMARPDRILEAETLVRPEWFFNPVNRYTYQMLVYLHQRAVANNWKVAFDDALVYAVARECSPQLADNFLRRTQGFENWHELMAYASRIDPDLLEQYARDVRDRAARVKMFRDARKLQLAAMNVSANPDASRLACEYETKLSTVAFGSATDPFDRVRPLGDYVDNFDIRSRLSHQHPTKSIFHLKHDRFHRWMSILGGGFRRNSLTIIAARPKVGKSTLLLNLAIDFANMNIPVLLLDTEMSGEEQVSRQLSNVTEINEHDLLTGKFMDDGASWNQVQVKMQEIRGRPIQYMSIAGKPVDLALALIRQFAVHTVGEEQLPYTDENGQQRVLTVRKPCVVLYDWLKIPSMGDLTNGVKEYQALGDIASRLKDAAKQLNLPIIAGAQNNRNAVGKEEMDHVENAEGHVAGSDRLIQFCNTLCILRNPSMVMGDAIEQNWPPGSPHARPGKEGNAAWPFNQILQIVVQRQGRDCRYGIPFYLDRGHAKYDEIASTPELPLEKFLKTFAHQKKQPNVGTQVTSSQIPDAIALNPPAPK